MQSGAIDCAIKAYLETLSKEAAFSNGRRGRGK